MGRVAEGIAIGAQHQRPLPGVDHRRRLASPAAPGLAGYLGTALALGAGWTSRRLWRWRPRWACWAA